MPEDEKLSFEIEVDDKGTLKVRRFKRAVAEAERGGVKFSRSAVNISRKLSRLTLNAGAAALKVGALGAAAVTAAGAFAAWKIKQLASSFIATGASMDKLKLSLDTITKGEGEAWFKRLNEWALKMPINTQKAIEAFTMMRAMGLKPTIKDMTTLVDATSALGGGEDTLEGIARALGQIHTKGKVSAEELMQLAERGIPAYQILQEKLGLTAEQVSNIGNAGVKAEDAVKALLEGMQERFGGQSEKIQTKWSGLMESLKAYWTEFKRLVMDSGVMAWLEENLKAIVDWADYLYESGTLQQWAQEVADWVIDLGERFKDWFQNIFTGFNNLETTITTWARKAADRFEGVIKVAQALLRVINFIVNAAERAGAWAGTMAANAEISTRRTVSEAETMAFQSGTGPAGLPYTGWFYGHRGEIVKNPAESEQERRGGRSGGNTYILQPTFMTGDRASIARAYDEFKQMEKRWGLT